jgi:hypothetical protein
MTFKLLPVYTEMPEVIFYTAWRHLPILEELERYADGISQRWYEVYTLEDNLNVLISKMPISFKRDYEVVDSYLDVVVSSRLMLNILTSIPSLRELNNQVEQTEQVAIMLERLVPAEASSANIRVVAQNMPQIKVYFWARHFDINKWVIADVFIDEETSRAILVELLQNKYGKKEAEL